MHFNAAHGQSTFITKCIKRTLGGNMPTGTISQYSFIHGPSNYLYTGILHTLGMHMLSRDCSAHRHTHAHAFTHTDTHTLLHTCSRVISLGNVTYSTGSAVGGYTRDTLKEQAAPVIMLLTLASSRWRWGWGEAEVAHCITANHIT